MCKTTNAILFSNLFNNILRLTVSKAGFPDSAENNRYQIQSTYLYTKPKENIPNRFEKQNQKLNITQALPSSLKTMASSKKKLFQKKTENKYSQK